MVIDVTYVAGVHPGRSGPEHGGDAARSALHAVIDELPDTAEVGLRVFGAKVFSRNDPGACQDTHRSSPPPPTTAPT